MRHVLVIALVASGCSLPAAVDLGRDGGPVEDGSFPFLPFDEGPPPPQTGPDQQPFFGATVSLTTPPPPLSGGTLLILRDGNTAVATDPDRDHVYVVDLSTFTVLADVLLAAGDEPGRAVEDAAGRVQVVLRRGGALATLDPATWMVSARRAVCAAPRGLAYQASSDLVHVACAGGELVSLPAAGGAATRTLRLDSDLRDVIVDGTQLRVSRFRTAELLTLDGSGQVIAHDRPPAVPGFSPAIAWRTVAQPGGGALVIHQRGVDGVVSPTPGGYGSTQNPCGAIVESVVSSLRAGTVASSTGALAGAVLPVDVALTPDGTKLAVVAAGNAHLPFGGSLLVYPFQLSSSASFTCDRPVEAVPATGEPVALAFDGRGRLVVQSREPADLQVFDLDSGSQVGTVSLASTSREDTGHAVFHANSGADIACASCHAEGGDDARVWTFGGEGPRRTQALRGKISGTEPFHWNGDQKDFPSLVVAVFEQRMSGPFLQTDQVQALQHFVDSIPLISPSLPADAQAVENGRVLFQSAGCTGCHSGAEYSNNQGIDVGTGGTFQVPRLVGLWSRAPYLHDGCAATLADRFGPCGGASHGNTASLTAAQIADLVAFLGTL